MLGTLLRFLLAVGLAVGALPFCVDLLLWVLRGIQARAQGDWRLLLPNDAVGIAVGAGLGAGWMLMKRPNWLFHTFIHELCHAVACLVLRVKLLGFHATDGKGGMVEYMQPGVVRGTLIAIAPYTLPLLLAPALGVRHAVHGGDWGGQISAGAVAFLWFTHLQGLWHNVRLNFTGEGADLVKVGRPLSMVLIAGCLLLVTAWTLFALWLP